MIVYGRQIFFYVLDKHPEMIEEVYLSKNVEKKIFSKIVKLGKKIEKLDNKKAQSLARGGNHQGYFLKVKEVQFASMDTLKECNFLLVLTGITDMGNIGAIIRTAYALGVDGIIVSGIKNINLEAAVRTSSGALFDLPIQLFENSADLVNELKQSGFITYGAVMDAQDIRGMNFKDKRVLMLGSESEGIPNKILNKIDQKVSIVMDREFDSLNVSAAAAILCDRMR